MASQKVHRYGRGNRGAAAHNGAARPMHGAHAKEWRRYGFGGPPEPWESGAQRELDRLATSYYVAIVASRTVILEAAPGPEMRRQVEELFSEATRHKQEVDFTLRHWATPVERLRVEDRIGSLMRISRRLHSLRGSSDPHRDTDPADSSRRKAKPAASARPKPAA
jgi:hypothetical protein